MLIVGFCDEFVNQSRESFCQIADLLCQSGLLLQSFESINDYLALFLSQFELCDAVCGALCFQSVLQAELKVGFAAQKPCSFFPLLFLQHQRLTILTYLLGNLFAEAVQFYYFLHGERFYPFIVTRNSSFVLVSFILVFINSIASCGVMSAMWLRSINIRSQTTLLCNKSSLLVEESTKSIAG